MADIELDPFGEHESRSDEPTDESTPLIPGGGGPTWNQTVNKKRHSEEEEV